MEPSVSLVSDSFRPPLYSGAAIWVFSLLFSPIVGGILTAQNLKDSGHLIASRKALWGSIGAMLLLMGLLYNLPSTGRNSSLSMGVGLGGGVALEFYAKKYIGDWKEHPVKRIWKPLLICLAVFVPVIALMIYAVANSPVE
jgi:hypothetical protein